MSRESLGLDDLHNFGSLWAIGMVAGCLIPDLGVI